MNCNTSSDSPHLVATIEGYLTLARLGPLSEANVRHGQRLLQTVHSLELPSEYSQQVRALGLYGSIEIICAAYRERMCAAISEKDRRLLEGDLRIWTTTWPPYLATVLSQLELVERDVVLSLHGYYPATKFTADRLIAYLLYALHIVRRRLGRTEQHALGQWEWGEAWRESEVMRLLRQLKHEGLY